MMISGSGALGAPRYTPPASPLSRSGSISGDERVSVEAEDPVAEHVVTIHRPPVSAPASGPALAGRAAQAIPPAALRAQLGAIETELTDVRHELETLPPPPARSSRIRDAVPLCVSLLGMASVGSLVTGVCLTIAGQGQNGDDQAAGIGLLVGGVAGLVCLCLGLRQADAHGRGLEVATRLRERESALVRQRDDVLTQMREARNPLITETLSTEAAMPRPVIDLVLGFLGEPEDPAPAPAAV